MAEKTTSTPSQHSHVPGGVPGGVEKSDKGMSAPKLDPSKIVGIRPVRAVTPEEIETFWRDGVVKLEQVFPEAAIDFIQRAFDDIFTRQIVEEERKKAKPFDFQEQAAELVARGERSRLLADGGFHEGKAEITGRFISSVDCFRWHTDFRRWCQEGPLPEIVAQVLRSKTLKFYNDHCFYKEAGSLVRTAFHQDASFFVTGGEQVAICWVPCDVVTKESGAMGYVRGSHRWPNQDGSPGVVFQPKNLVSEAQQPLREHMGEDMGPPLPDIERNEQDYDVVYHACRPGDVVIHHLNTVHGSAGNTSTSRHRRAASIRYIGDDVVYKNKNQLMMGNVYMSPSADSPIAKKMLAEVGARGADGQKRKEPRQPKRLVDGQPFEGSLFPVCWPRDSLERQDTMRPSSNAARLHEAASAKL